MLKDQCPTCLEYGLRPCIRVRGANIGRTLPRPRGLSMNDLRPADRGELSPECSELVCGRLALRWPRAIRPHQRRPRTRPYCDFCLAEALSGTRPIIKTGALKAYKIVLANPEAPATFACYMTDATLRRGELLDYDGRVWNVMNKINRPG